MFYWAISGEYDDEEVSWMPDAIRDKTLEKERKAVSG